jgi:hypothetical protein
MEIKICHEAEPYRMITNGMGRYAVIEARNGRVYSLDGHDRHEAEDTPAGMAQVVGRGWQDHERASRRFLHMARGEKHYGETLW